MQNSVNKIKIQKETIELIKKFSKSEITFNEIEEIDLIDDLGFDSLVLMELIAEIEKKYNISFGASELEFDNIVNYQKLVRSILYKLKGDI